MQTYFKNIRFLLVRIPCLIMSVLMLCALVLVANSQHNELISGFRNQCKQYETSLNLLLSKQHSKASFITQNNWIAENLEIQNYIEIGKRLNSIHSTSYHEISALYIVNQKNEYFSRPTALDSKNLFTFEDVARDYNMKLFYSEHDETPSGKISIIYPIYQNNGQLCAGLVLEMPVSKILEELPNDAENPPCITIESPDFSYQTKKKYPSILYTGKNRITLPDSHVTFTLSISIFPVVKTVFSMLCLFLAILLVFFAILRFLAHCVIQSINQPLSEIEKTLNTYSDSITPQNQEAGSDSYDE